MKKKSIGPIQNAIDNGYMEDNFCTENERRIIFYVFLGIIILAFIGALI